MNEPERDLFIKTAEKAVKQLEAATRAAEKVVVPYRTSAFKRFPILFPVLVAFGGTATFFGFELIIMEISWLYERPFFILGVGILTLVLTGTLYKKLG